MLPLGKPRLFIGVILGALLIATLLFFLKNQKSNVVGDESNLKPSQLDFSKSNQPQSLPATEMPTTTVRIKNSESMKNLSSLDAGKMQILDEILRSKNDNDPRMDHELKNMSATLHEALFEKYDLMVSEDRNGRGTIAFLIARDLKSQQDADFLKNVFNENPCTSMANCNQVSQEDSHLGGIEQNSLNYPQLAILYQIESRIDQNKNLLTDRNYMGWVLEILRQAQRFPVPIVKDKAEALLQKYGL